MPNLGPTGHMRLYKVKDSNTYGPTQNQIPTCDVMRPSGISFPVALLWGSPVWVLWLTTLCYNVKRLDTSTGEYSCYIFWSQNQNLHGRVDDQLTESGLTRTHILFTSIAKSYAFPEFPWKPLCVPLMLLQAVLWGRPFCFHLAKGTWLHFKMRFTWNGFQWVNTNP